MNGGQLDGYGWSVWVEPTAPIVARRVSGLCHHQSRFKFNRTHHAGNLRTTKPCQWKFPWNLFTSALE